MTQTEEIIFLISQPRAGSTLTQKLIGNHPDILTASEPWILLHPFSALRSSALKSEDSAEGMHEAIYDAAMAKVGVESFLDLLPGGEEAYIQQLASLYTSLYQQVSASQGKRFFLDKTPRYYHIIPELARAFPQAHFIFLLRNPLAVLGSILNIWIDDFWPGLRIYKHDLVTAPGALLKGIDLLGDRATVMHYEELLQDPKSVMTKISQSLGIEFSSALLEYGESELKDWKLGDPSRVYQHSAPDAMNIERWVGDLAHPQKWRFARDYLILLGPDTIQQMGYDYSRLAQILAESRPNQLAVWKTLPLNWVLKSPHDFASFNYGYLPVKLLNMLQRKGPAGAAKAFVQGLFRSEFSPASQTTAHAVSHTGQNSIQRKNKSEKVNPI